MKLTFIGADHEVTGSCTYLEAAGKKLIIDYGMEQGRDTYVNASLPVMPSELDAVLLTHAHIDHSGMLPALFKMGFKNGVYATDATCNLCGIMLRDSAHIQEFEAEWRNRKAQRSGEPPYEPPYTMQDAEGILKLMQPRHYGERFTLFDGVDVRFVDAGHLLGSASIELWLTEEGVTKKIVFSGDIGNVNQPLINDPTLIDSADYVVMESTYGDRVHEAPPDYAQALSQVLQTTFDRGGSVIIPSFAVGRTQELLYFIRHIKAEGMVHGHDSFPVYVDSPLANSATRIFMENADSCYDPEARSYVEQGINPLIFPGLTLTQTSDESRSINDVGSPKVVISASGMCEAGRIKHHLKHHLWSEKNTILFVGFQAEGTLGRSLVEGAKRVKLFGDDVQVVAQIQQLPGISGHADSKMLEKWITHIAPKPAMVFINHGEDDAMNALKAHLTDAYGLTCSLPYSGSVYNLLTGAYEFDAEPVALEVKEARENAAAMENSPFARLLAALDRLTKLLKNGQSRSNRELKDITRQLNNICEEWER